MEETIEKLLQQGFEFHQLGQAEFASQIYKAILLAEPNHPEANYNMGLLAVSAGQIEAGLTFLETALEANADNAIYWVSYIDVLLEIGRIEDAQAVFDQAKFNGAKGEGFDKLEQRLTDGRKDTLTANSTGLEEKHPKQPNILNSLKLDQAINLAKKKAKEGAPEEAKRIFEDILTKFPKNKRASDGLEGLAGIPVGKASKVQDPSLDQLQALIDLYSQGQPKGALKQVENLVHHFPRSAFLFSIQGTLLKSLGQFDLSIAAFNKALAIKPDYKEVYNDMGNALKEQGKLDEATEAYNKALAIKPDYADAHYNMGCALKEQGKLEEAIEAYKKALSIKPDYAKAYNNMGVTLQEQVKLEEAIEAYNKALAIKPDYADAYNNIGIALNEQGKLEEAIEAYKKALAIKPDYADAYNNMGIVLKHQGKLDEAIEAYNKVLVIKPDYAEAYTNMGNALEQQGKLEEAIEASKKALAIKPDSAEAYSNMGNVLQEQGKLEEAIEAYNKALVIKPDYAEAHHNLSFALLSNGNLKKGLEEYEWRWKKIKNVDKKRQFSKPMWDGKEILKGKKILLWCEQGVGDTINWSSKLPLIASLAQHCILECPEKLVPLMVRSFPNIEVKPEDRRNDEQRNDFDYHLPLGTLYRNFLPEILKESRLDAFLLPDPTRIKFWTKRLKSLGKGPYIGVSWKSANMSPKRLPNYAPLADWSPIFTIPGVTFINLQYTDFTDDLIEIQNKFGVTVHNFDDLNHFDDLDDVAALCAALDIVVSTKITVPLISAGVGTATKLANWRQSAWNNILLNPVGPFVDVFERNTWETWGNVFIEIAQDIDKMQNKRHDNSGGN